MRALLIFIAGLLVGANAVYFLMTWGEADPDAAIVFQREASQHAQPPVETGPPDVGGTATNADDALPATGAVPRPRTPASPPVAPPAAPPVAGPEVAASGLIVPVQGVRPTELSNTFDDARGQGRVHEAIDIMAPLGTPVLAVVDGKVEKLFDSVPGGLTIYQFDPAGRHAYYYAHLDRYAAGLVEGKALKQGEVVGYVGSTGNASEDAPHLHFGIFVLGPEKRWWEGTAINPYPILTGKQPLLQEARFH